MRLDWRMGKITQLVEGRDGQIGGAKLKVMSKKRNQTAVFRPIQRLVPFEIGEANEEDEQPSKEVEENENEDESKNKPSEGTNEKIIVRRPGRKAALEGQNRRRITKQYN